MGALEEGGKVAVSTVEALKSQPGLLVLVFLQVSTLVSVYFVSQANGERVQARELAMIERCFTLDQTKE